ncbi:uncharacterized protein [Miscanthus floridulus]|uniref:uncharacterized protein n=1 Tax=Miscanthus floridulus TaxID=154761 RepID=UPI0034597B70
MARGASVPAAPATLLALLAAAIAAAAGAGAAGSSICDTARCGKGSCSEAPGPYPFESYKCTCDPGWSQPEPWIPLTKLPNAPCVVPNCSFSSACLNLTVPIPNVPLDQCFAVNCGLGGDCEKGAGVSYQCRCKPGFKNLLNDTSMPCIGSSCTFGADCAKLGLVNTPAAPAPAPVGNDDLY